MIAYADSESIHRVIAVTAGAGHRCLDPDFIAYLGQATYLDRLFGGLPSHAANLVRRRRNASPFNRLWLTDGAGTSSGGLFSVRSRWHLHAIMSANEGFGAAGAHVWNGDLVPPEEVGRRAAERWAKYMADPANAEYERLKPMRKARRNGRKPPEAEQYGPPNPYALRKSFRPPMKG